VRGNGVVDSEGGGVWFLIPALPSRSMSPIPWIKFRVTMVFVGD